MTRSVAFIPRLMTDAQASHYLGVSRSTLRSLGLPRRVRGANRLYDVNDLDAFADGLPYDRESGGEEVRTCDVAFGLGSC